MSYSKISIEITPSHKRDLLTLKAIKRGENMGISEFILDIGEKIEEVSGAKLNFSQQATVPEEKWIPETQEKMLLKSVQLRTEKQTQNLEVVKLKKFDPCWLKANSEISCRVHGCLQTTSRLSTKRRTKQDVFLCKAHRQELTDLISKCCAKENVTSFQNSNDCEGYTSLIGALEKAFVHLKSKRLTATTTDALLAEVFLNTRNFLIITNALLNPDEDNTATAVGPYLTVFLRLLEDPIKLGKVLILLLGGVMNVVLTFYGIAYQWVNVPLENPGAKIGFGMGILFVTLLALVSDVVPFWLKCLSCSFAPLAMSLIGNGIYDWNADPPSIEERRKQMAQNQTHFLKPVHHYFLHGFDAPADAAGNLNIEQNG